MKFLFLCSRNGYYCELNYAACVAIKYIAPMIANMGHEVKVVVDPTPEVANNIINSWNPDFVWWIGHGNVSVTTLQHLTIWISDQQHCDQGWGNRNREILNGRIANGLSCLTAHCLGLSLTKNYGCRWYLGYYEEFWFIWCGCPHTWGCACGQYNPYRPEIRDTVLAYCMMCMHESNLYFNVGIAKGFTPAQAHGYSLARFEQWKKTLSNIKPISQKEAALIATAIKVLNIDEPIQRLCHDGSYIQPEKPPEMPPPIPPVGKAALNITSSPEGATIYINGEKKGVTPLQIVVSPGTYTIRATKPGYEPAETTITVKADKTYNIHLDLKKATISQALAFAPLLALPVAYYEASQSGGVER